MARALVNKQIINISESGRATEKSFTQQVASRAIGPDVAAVSAGDNVSINTPAPVTVYTWKTMTVGDAGLKSAIYEFINTSKEGVKVTPDVIRGREKKLVFNFYGTIGKSIMPGEIGEFEVIFSYPPTVATVGGSSSTAATNTA